MVVATVLLLGPSTGAGGSFPRTSAPHVPSLLFNRLLANRSVETLRLQVIAALTLRVTLVLRWPRTISVIRLQHPLSLILVLVTDVTPRTCLCLSFAGMFKELSPSICVLITLPTTLLVDPPRIPQSFGLSYFLNPLLVLLGRTLVLLLLTMVRNREILKLDISVVPLTMLDICLFVCILVKLLVRSRLESIPIILDVSTRASNVHDFGHNAVLVLSIVEAKVVVDPMTPVPIRPLVTLVVFRLDLMINAMFPLFGFAQLLTRSREPVLPMVP